MERASQLSLVVLASLAMIAALDLASDLAAPMVFALVMGVVLSPLSQMWERLGLSSAFGALASLILSLVFLGGLVLLLQPLVAQMVDQAPKVWADLQDVIKAVRGLLQGITDAARDVSQATVPAASAQEAPPSAPAEGVGVPTVTDALMIAPALAAQIVTFIGTLFFFLLTRNEIYNWVARRLSTPANRGTVAARLRDAERIVSRYFLTITMINAGLGLATAGLLQALGLPGALLWGIIAFLVNYIVYLGPAVLILALTFAGVAAFDGALALVPAIGFAALNFCEGQFITPALVGKRMEMNALVVFVSLLFGIWLWGAIGGIVAIPLMLWAIVLKNGLSEAQSA